LIEVIAESDRPRGTVLHRQPRCAGAARETSSSASAAKSQGVVGIAIAVGDERAASQKAIRLHFLRIGRQMRRSAPIASTASFLASPMLAIESAWAQVNLRFERLIRRLWRAAPGHSPAGALPLRRRPTSHSAEAIMARTAAPVLRAAARIGKSEDVRCARACRSP
jgi:hypothetical protein